MFKVTYYYSACVTIHTDDITIICDPWFTDGAYDGTWYQYPKIKNPLEVLPRAGYIYVSHIHPDHYDAVFLRSYLEKYPHAKVIIADFKQNFLSRKMTHDGIPHQIFSHMKIGSTEFKIFPNELSSYDVDSALVVKMDKLNVVNMNDNLFNQVQLKNICDYVNGNVFLSLISYTGAGAYPQTYHTDEKILTLKAEEKKNSFFERFKSMRDILNPRYILPFAGKYHLGGRLTALNKFRGVADAVEVLSFCERSFVLDDGGEAFFDLETKKASALRTQKYSEKDLQLFYDSISDQKFDSDFKFANLKVEDLPLTRLLRSAYDRAIKKSLVTTPYFFIFKLPDSKQVVISLNKNEPFFEINTNTIEGYLPRSEIQVDSRYLFGLLTCIYHWNNAEIGSHFFVRRHPDIFNRDVQAFLNFFHV